MKKNNNLKLTTCEISGDNNPLKYFTLGEIPLVNNLCYTREESLSCERFPLNLNYFESSKLTSLDFVVDPDKLFSNYFFKSSVNLPYYKHCQDMFSFISDFIKIDGKTKIVDIGGNDGTLLEAFQSVSNIKLDLLNIDPSENLSKICMDKSIKVLNDFFNLESSNKINYKMDLITSTNVFQHTKDIKSFALGIQNLLSDNGLWVLEFPYWIHDMETMQFDQIYHEHIYYYSITPLKILFENCGLRIINITKQNIHGGTLRVVICKDSSRYKTDFTLEIFLNHEKSFNRNYYLNWGNDVSKHINDSKELIQSIKDSGSKIFGFGAAAKGCVYLNTLEIDYNYIDYVIDDTDIKQGKFIPGTGIEIVSREILKTKKPDYIIILTHNFANYIMESLNGIYDGKFILLLPEIKVI